MSVRYSTRERLSIFLSTIIILHFLTQTQVGESFSFEIACLLFSIAIENIVRKPLCNRTTPCLGDAEFLSSQGKAFFLCLGIFPASLLPL